MRFQLPAAGDSRPIGLLSGGFSQRASPGAGDGGGEEEPPVVGWALATLASRGNLALLQRLEPDAEERLQGSLGPWPRDGGGGSPLSPGSARGGDDTNEHCDTDEHCGGDGGDDGNDAEEDDGGTSVSSEAAFEQLQRAQARDAEGVHRASPRGGGSFNSGGFPWSAGGPFPQYLVVVAGPLHLHSEPGVGGRIVAELAGGAMLKAIGQSQDNTQPLYNSPSFPACFTSL